jgi:hypothetical protein
MMRSGVPLREPGFVDHPRAAPLRASRASLHLCDPPAPAAVGDPAIGGTKLAPAFLCTARGVPVVRARAAGRELGRALQSWHRVRTLHLESPRASFGGFEDAVQGEQFAQRADSLLGSWCCVQKRPGAGKSGHPRARIGGNSRLMHDVDASDRSVGALHGASFRLHFHPRLGRPGRRPASATASWEAVELVNNVFGRAAARVGKDSACCKYLGLAESLKHCTSMAERLQGVTSVTWHRKKAIAGPWAGTCYGVIDGTWQPVPVEKGQAEADSARRVGEQTLQPAAELTTPWITE